MNYTMKTVAICLGMSLVASFGWAQDYEEGPYYGEFDKDLVIREGFSVDDKGELNLNRNAEYRLVRQEDGTYKGTVDLPKEFLVSDKQGGFYQSDYYYAVQFDGANNGADDCGPRIDPAKLRSFNLEADGTVTFYARLWQNTDGSKRIQFICDAQRPSIYLSNITGDEWTGTGLYDFLNRPGADGIGRYVTPVSTTATGKVELQFRTVGRDNFEQQADILDNYHVQKFYVANTKTQIGRWQIAYDYPHFELSWNKVLDGMENPTIEINGTAVGDLTAADEDVVTELLLGGSFQTQVVYDKASVDFSKVNAWLCYSIDEGETATLALSRTAGEGTSDDWTIAEPVDALASTDLENGEHSLKLWYETEYLGDVLRLDNDGAGYVVPFVYQSSTSGVAAIAGADDTLSFVALGNGAVEVSSPKSQTVAIYAIDGRLAKSVAVGKGKTVVDGLAQGIYVAAQKKIIVR